MNEFLNNFFGWPTLILLLIPVVILVRIFVRTSRWSILKVSGVAVFGTLVSSAWLFYASLITGINLGGEWGKAVGQWLADKVGDSWAFYLLSTGLLVWFIAASLDLIISGARYFIHKPYIREIIVEVEKEVEVEPKPVKKTTPKQKEPKKVAAKDPGELKSLQEYDDLGYFKSPTPALLSSRTEDIRKVSPSEIHKNIETIRETLADHHVQVADIKAISGPTVTLYKVYPAKGVKVAAIRNLHEDIAVALESGTIRAHTLTDSVGLEVPNITRSLVPIRQLVSSSEFKESKAELPIAIGSTIDGKTKVFDLAKAPHLLVAGSTNQGKSVGLNVIAASLLYAKRPSELKMIFIDPKGTEFTPYKNLYRHYLAVTTTAASEEDEIERSIPIEPKDADEVLRALCAEMKERYELLRQAGSCPNIKTYNQKFLDKKLRPDHGHRFLPYIVAVIDEYAQLTLVTSGKPEIRNVSRSITASIISLAQMGRAAGIHMIIATQTPRKDVISGMIKANFPTMISFKVANSTESQVVLDNTGAEKLIGNGDMLFSQNANIERIQCGYIGPEEINALTRSIEIQKGAQKCYSTPYYLPEVKDEENSDDGTIVDMKKIDPKFEEAARLVVSTGRASTSYLQTQMGMGFARSARVMSQLEAAGIVGPQNSSKNREVLVENFSELDEIISKYLK
jgi:S-DNA-T family DNA segregation ATPase FtsK/SpoIIIE